MNKLPEHIHYVGVDDDNIDLFEAQYPVSHGISYNSYIIEDEHIAIVDTVDRRVCGEWLAKVRMKLDGRAPSYLIVNHTEPDHSGSIRALLEQYPGIRVVASAKALAMLANFFEDIDFEARSMAIADNGTLALGRTALRFITAPMVHWPEVIVTLDETDGVLFSADAFGSFATASCPEAWDTEARRYYTNIVGKYGNSVQALLKKVSTHSVNIIAPLHGPVLTDNLGHHIALYDKWSRYEPEARGTLIAYASVYGGITAAARRLASILQNRGERNVVLMDLCRHDVSQAVAEAFRLDKMVLCSVTYDGNMFPAMHNFIHHIALKGLTRRRVGLVENGSWAPVAARLMAGELAAMRDMTVIEPAVTLRGTLHDSDTAALEALAGALTAGA